MGESQTGMPIPLGRLPNAFRPICSLNVTRRRRDVRSNKDPGEFLEAQIKPNLKCDLLGSAGIVSISSTSPILGRACLSLKALL